MPDLHSILSASSFERWSHCTPSALLERRFPDQGSPYAAEGTTAHALAEVQLKFANGDITKRKYNAEMKRIREDSDYYNQEMDEYILSYCGRVWEAVNEIKKTCPDPMVAFEQRLDFSEYVPQGFGTGDVVIVADDLLQIIDLKYGKGVPVDAHGNGQLRLYALGAYLDQSMLYDIKRIRTTIIQPRIDNYSEEEISVEELLRWAKEVVRPAAALAIKGEGEQTPGPWCRFCKAGAVCRARAEKNKELLVHDLCEPELLDDDEIADILGCIDELKEWSKAVEDYALKQALAGTEFHGWKVVEGTSRRKIVNVQGAAEALQKDGHSITDIYKPAELKGLTDLEKLVGKKHLTEVIGKFIEKPEGKPTLVPETDKRPALNNKDKLKEDF